MHGVNLDLLRATVRPTDRHAHHKSDHLADLREARRQHWLDRFARVRALFDQHRAPAPQPCPEQAP
ncbi:hypothetical protein [Rhodobacter sp. SY28-1]|uniref:hypothetical protein n=1 Tax=Rhodobacter sp. SY28-1 TaxID=2562317 RepID=UPI0010C0BDE7|nr:hypothetical protein [Rhodobacter sp. SY28-1]